MYQIKVTDREIDDVIDQCIESEGTGQSKFSGMTYEQGVRAAIDWILGDEEMGPLED